MSHIRTMQVEDLDQVIEIEAAAFGAWYRQVYGEEGGIPQRKRTNVRSCLIKDPAGCFVAQEDDQLVGFIFSRTWGSVGWFGTFSVLPELQGKGIGMALEHLLHWDYRVERAMLRMVVAGTDSGSTVDHHVNLVRWAG